VFRRTANILKSSGSARSVAVSPSSVRASREAPSAKSTSAIRWCPFAAAACKAVQLSSSFWSICAPCFSKRWTTTKLLSRTAWWRAVMPAMLILFTSMSTLALRSSAMIAIPSLSLMLSSKTTSSGNRTLRLPGFCRAKTLALRDMTVSGTLSNLCKYRSSHAFFPSFRWFAEVYA